MDISNLKSLVELITPQGWQHLREVVDEVLTNLPQIDLHEEASKTKLLPLFSKTEYEQPKRSTYVRPKNIDSKKLKENPYSNSSFIDSGFDPYGGFFKTPNATMHNAFKIAYEDEGTVKVDDNFLDLKCTIYAHFKLTPEIIKQMVAGYLATITLLKKPAYGSGPNVIASVNGLKIALMPDLKLAGYSGADSFGMYHFAGKLDYILMNSEIFTNNEKKAVIDEFNDATRKKIWEYSQTIKTPKDAWPTNYKETVMLIAVTLLHELGHRVERKCLPKQRGELHNFWTKHRQQLPISKYGIINPKEWFAECWAAWVVDGLSYSDAVKNDFLKLLFPPKHKQNNVEVLTDSGKIFDYQTLKKIFESSHVQVNDPFSLKIIYSVGPELEIAGTLVKIVNHEIPTIRYNDNTSLKTLNFFPNRKIVKIKCDRL